jgi:phosphoribosylanthranilate isomerase
MKIKVCGTREPENIQALIQLPIDYIGFIFHPGSPRFVGEGDELGAWVRAHEKDFGDIQRVGVFVNAEIDEILNKVHDYRLDLVQLHGAERPEYCRELAGFWEVSSMRRAGLVKAFSIGGDFDFSQVPAYESVCSLFIFDTKGDAPGGTGKVFDWSLLDRYQGMTPFLLAGGIGPESVDAIRRFPHLQFAGVDINSRFETAPGVKNVEMVRAFATTLKPAGGH